MKRNIEAVHVRSVRSLGAAPTLQGENWLLIGQDGGQSIALPDGRVLFVFSDSLFAHDVGQHAGGGSLPAAQSSREQGIFLGNCAALTDAVTDDTTDAGASLGDLKTGLAEMSYFLDSQQRPTEVLKASGAEQFLGVRLWPAHGLAVDDRVLLFYLGIQHLDGETWGFESLGSGLAELDLATGVAQRLEQDGDWRLWPRLDDGLHMGVQVCTAGDCTAGDCTAGDTVYVFGSRRRGMSCSALLATVKRDQLTDPKAYRYLSGPGPQGSGLQGSGPQWSADLEQAWDLGPAAPEFSVSWNAHLQRWLMFFVDGYDKQLCLRTSEQIWGPYSAVQRLGELAHRADSAFISLGFEHSTFARDGGRTVFVTYCQPNFAQNTVVAVRFE